MVAFPYDVTRTRVFGDGALTRMADVLDEVCASALYERNARPAGSQGCADAVSAISDTLDIVSEAKVAKSPAALTVLKRSQASTEKGLRPVLGNICE